jgi:hypothetical protein
VAAQEGMYYYAPDLVPFARVLAEAMTLVAGLVAAPFDCDLQALLEGMDSSGLEVAAPGIGADVLTTSC